MIEEDTADSVQLREVELAEISITESDGRHILEVTLIRPGTSRNGNHYPTEVLREALPLFEGARAFVDHQRDGDLPERSVRDLVGYYRQARLDESGKVRAQLHLVPGQDWLFHLLKEAEGNPNLCGLSIDALADVTREGQGNRVNAFRQISSVDIVTRPSAGGQVERVIQSDRPTAKETRVDPEKNERTDGNTTTVQKTEATNPQQPTENQPAKTEPTLAQLVEQLNADREKMRQELERVNAILNPQAPKPADPTAGIAQLAEELRRERDVTRCENVLTGKLSESGLPDPVKSKLRRQFAGRVFEAGTLEAAIAEEKETLAALTTAGQITGMGFEKSVSLGLNEYDQIQAAMDKLFDVTESEAARSVPGFSGIREAFKVCTGVDISQIGGVDRPLRESLRDSLRNKVMSGRLTEAEAILREADVTTSSFSYLLGTSMNKRLLMDYMAWPSEWQKITNIVAIKDFKTQDRVRLGAFGSLSTVSEDASYTTLTLSDTHATYAATKRGNLVQITRETIINDDLYSIKQIPQKLAVAAAFTLAEFVYNLLAPNFGNIYDAHPLFDSVNHANTGVIAANLNVANSGSALSSAALQAAVVAMRKQKNMASKPIGLKPRYLLVPPDLEFTAMTVLKSAGLPGGNNNDINPMMGYCEPIVSAQLNALTAGPASTSIWIAVADPKVIDTLEVGFVGGQANPVLLIQDLPLYGINFTQDVISYKVRHEYGGAVVDYRGFYLGNN